MSQSVNKKRFITRTGVDTVIDSELHERELFALFFGSCYRAQDIRHDPIGTFCLVIGLAMIFGRHVELASYKLKHMSPKPRRK